MMETLQVKTYAPPPIVRREILRYAGVKEATAEVTALLEECLVLAEKELVYKTVCRVCPVSVKEDEISLGTVRLRSEALKKNLNGCSRAVLFAATVGLALDRLIARYTQISPAKALLLQAVGAERIESLCDLFARDVAKELGETRPRFSPGYGDLPLLFQKDLFSLLTPEKTIGLSLSDSLLMIPSKSVTAIIGVKDR